LLNSMVADFAIGVAHADPRTKANLKANGTRTRDTVMIIP
jgi:hypothetical protein